MTIEGKRVSDPEMETAHLCINSIAEGFFGSILVVLCVGLLAWFGMCVSLLYVFGFSLAVEHGVSPLVFHIGLGCVCFVGCTVIACIKNIIKGGRVECERCERCEYKYGAVNNV